MSKNRENNMTIHHLAKIRIHWEIKGREYELYVAAKHFKEQMIELFENLVDEVEYINYTINNRTEKTDYYNFKGLP